MTSSPTLSTNDDDDDEFDAQRRVGGLQIGLLVHQGADPASTLRVRQALEELGALVKTIGPPPQLVGYTTAPEAEQRLDQAAADEFDALVLPGGALLRLADDLPTSLAAQQLVRDLHEQDKPIAAMGEALALLLAAGVAQGRQLSAHDDWAERIAEAGGTWRGEAVVVDGRLVTCRGDLPGDDALAPFLASFIQVLAERTRQSTRGTADDSAGSAGMGG